MEKFEIKNRYSGATQVTASIECDANANLSLKKGLAVQWALTVRADLSGADLSRADLSGADLSGTDLSGTDLSGAYLSRTDLSGAYLSGTDLSGAYLSGTDLSRAYLRGADLSGAYLSGAYLRGADLRGAYLSGDKITRLFARATRLAESYEFFAFEIEGGAIKILAGCRWLAPGDYREHAQTYGDAAKQAETLAIIDFIDARTLALGVSAQVGFE